MESSAAVEKDVPSPEYRPEIVPRTVEQKQEFVPRDCRLTDSTVSNESYTEVYVYNTGDPTEDARLRDLHGVMDEIYKQEKKFVQFLMDIRVSSLGHLFNGQSSFLQDLPLFLDEHVRWTNRKVWATTNRNQHIIYQLSRHAAMMFAGHKLLMDEIGRVFSYW